MDRSGAFNQLPRFRPYLLRSRNDRVPAYWPSESNLTSW